MRISFEDFFNITTYTFDENTLIVYKNRKYIYNKFIEDKNMKDIRRFVITDIDYNNSKIVDNSKIIVRVEEV